MYQSAQIEASYNLSVENLTAYVITNCANRDFPENIVVATGFEYFDPDEDREIFLVYPLDEVISTTVKITKLETEYPCEICSSNIEQPMADVYASEENFDQFLQTHSDFTSLPDYRSTQIFNICRDCQSAIVTDLHVDLPSRYKVARNI